jgi:hypothetical protein
VNCWLLRNLATHKLNVQHPLTSANSLVVFLEATLHHLL